MSESELSVLPAAVAEYPAGTVPVGLAHTSAGNSSILLASAPVIVAIESHFLKVERLSARAWAGVLLSFVGLGLVIVGGSQTLSLAPETLLGDVLTLGAAMCWG